jgi:hypothetical protein
MFMDTTSLYGYSKDYRSDLRQLILAPIVDGAGRPISTEMWLGNTADVATLLPVIDRLRRRFSSRRRLVGPNRRDANDHGLVPSYSHRYVGLAASCHRPLARPNQRFNLLPFGVGQIARIS